MAQPKRQAQFFVNSNGICFAKAKPLSYRERLAVFQRDQSKCKVCGQAVKLGGLYDHPFDDGPVCGAIDHIIPRSRGGQNNQTNLRLTCKSCNSSKGAK